MKSDVVLKKIIFPVVVGVVTLLIYEKIKSSKQD